MGHFKHIFSLLLIFIIFWKSKWPNRDLLANIIHFQVKLLCIICSLLFSHPPNILKDKSNVMHNFLSDHFRHCKGLGVWRWLLSIKSSALCSCALKGNFPREETWCRLREKTNQRWLPTDTHITGCFLFASQWVANYKANRLWFLTLLNLSCSLTAIGCENSGSFQA